MEKTEEEGRNVKGHKNNDKKMVRFFGLFLITLIYTKVSQKVFFSRSHII